MLVLGIQNIPYCRCLLFSQYFQFNELKHKWYVGIKHKLSGTNERPFEVLPLFPLFSTLFPTEITAVLFAQNFHNFPFYCLLVPPQTFFDQPMRSQVWNDWEKAFPFDMESFQNFQFWLNGKCPHVSFEQQFCNLDWFYP